MTDRGMAFLWLAPLALAAAALPVALEVDLPQRLWDAVALVERAYFVAFFDAVRFRFLCL